MDWVLPGTSRQEPPVVSQTFPQTVPQCVEKTCFACSFIRSTVIQNLFKYTKLAEQFQLSTDINHITTEHVPVSFKTSCTIVRVRLYSIHGTPQPSVLVMKILEQGSLSTLKSFKTEQMFYKVVAVRLRHLIHPKFHLKSKNISIREYPFIILDDLIALGYKQFEDKLKKIDLMKVIKLLALFHGHTMGILDKDQSFKMYVKEIFQHNWNKHIAKEQQAVRDFLNGSVLAAVNNGLRKKIKQKLNKLEKAENISQVLPLVHGSFTRDKIFYKYKVNNKYKMKFINFKAVMLGSPEIDFSSILLTNLPNDISNISKLEKFCSDVLTVYLKSLKKAFPVVDIKHVERDIIDNLLLSYINLIVQESEAIENHVQIWNMLKNLGSLD